MQTPIGYDWLQIGASICRLPRHVAIRAVLDRDRPGVQGEPQLHDRLAAFVLPETVMATGLMSGTKDVDGIYGINDEASEIELLLEEFKDQFDAGTADIDSSITMQEVERILYELRANGTDVSPDAVRDLLSSVDESGRRRRHGVPKHRDRIDHWKK